MTEDDTFTALRRAPYTEASVVYRNATRHLFFGTGSGASRDIWKSASESALRAIGWTFEELMEESVNRMEIRRKEVIEQEIKNVNP